MGENSFDDWCRVIKDIPMRKREPMWDGATKYLVAEGAMEPTVYDTLTQGQIQEMIMESDTELTPVSLADLFIGFGNWLVSEWGESRFYVARFKSGAELWLAYLLETRYALEWNGEAWVGVEVSDAAEEQSDGDATQ